MFLLVPAYPGCPGPKAVKRLCVCVFLYCDAEADKIATEIGCHSLSLGRLVVTMLHNSPGALVFCCLTSW